MHTIPDKNYVVHALIKIPRFSISFLD